MPEQNQKRQIAVKLRVADMLGGQYIKEEGWNPNYILTQDGRKASRVNLLGTIVSMPMVEINYRSAMIDDGSGKISVRSFDESDLFQGIALGDVVFVIGRPRQYGNEIYIMPEIVKKVKDKAWIDVRKLEIEKTIKNTAAAVVNKPASGNAMAAEEVVAEKVEHAKENKKTNPAAAMPSAQQRIYSIIKELDNGDGVGFEQVLEKAGYPDAEKIISQLLMEGEIFELGKGRLKVLE